MNKCRSCGVSTLASWSCPKCYKEAMDDLDHYEVDIDYIMKNFTEFEQLILFGNIFREVKK